MELRCISQHFSKKRKFNFEKKRSIVQLFINARRYDDALHTQNTKKKLKRKRNEKGNLSMIMKTITDVVFPFVC